MMSWYNPIIVWMYLIYIASSVIAGSIVIGYLVFKLIKRNEKRRMMIMKEDWSDTDAEIHL